MSKKPETDEITGTETTGHEWDGIKELDTPLPRWWLWTWLATIIWAIGYWIVMPAWPLVSDYTRGVWGYSQRSAVMAEVQAAKQARKIYSEKLLSADLETIKNDPDLLEFALIGGKSSFKDNCEACHGSGAAGSKGYPNLNDDDWLWGGSLDDIHHTLNVGIRGLHEDTRLSDMPAFLDNEILTRQEIKDVTSYIVSFTNPEVTFSENSQDLYQENCAMCHGEDGEGNKDVGAPNLSDAIWLYGADKQSIINTISHSRKGVMPAWAGRLDEATIRALAVYVHSLGGGE